MSKMIRRGVICLLSAAVPGACATGASGKGAQTVMVSALTKSEAASTFHITATEKMKSLSGTPYLSMSGVTMSGDVDLSTDSSHLNATLVGASPAAGGASQSISFEMIQIGNDTWDSTTGLGALVASAPPGHWVKDGPSSSRSQIPDPAKLFAALKAAATKVISVGSATVDGAECNGYRLLGSANLLDSLGTSPSDQPVTSGPVSIDVWVDKSNLVRRLSTTIEQNMGDPGQVESVALTVDFTDYGEAVHIEPPPSRLIVTNP